LISKLPFFARSLALGFFVPVFAFAHGQPVTLNEKAALVSKINPAKAISRTAAFAIFDLYCTLHLPFRCLPTAVHDSGEFWDCFPSINDDCIQAKIPIRINKVSGRISWSGGTNYDTPAQLVKVALTLRSTRTPPALSSALSQPLATSASFGASVQPGPVSFIR